MERVRGSGPDYLLAPYQTRFNSPARVAENRERFGVVLGGIGGLAGRSNGPAAVAGLAGFVVGVVAIGLHIPADALIPAGVRPFAPYRYRHYTYDLARVSNPIANYALLTVGIAAVVAVLALGNG